MKKSLTVISILGVGAAVAFANFPNPITTDTTDVIQMTDALVMGADNVTVTHSYTGPRHWAGSLDLNGYDGTKLVIHNVTANPSSDYFGFNGVTFKNTGGSNTDMLKITNTGDDFKLMNGFTVSNMTMHLNVGTTMPTNSSHAHAVNIKDNASLYWSKAANSTATYSPIVFTIGTEGSATDTNSFLNFGYNTRDWGNSAGLTVYNGYFYMSDADGRINFSTATIHALSADSFIQDIGVSTSFTVDAGIDHKIYTLNNNIVIYNESTLTLNSEEVFYKGYLTDTKDSEGYVIASTLNKTTNRVGLYFTNASTNANVVLGANNTFARIGNNAGKTLTLTLNGNVFTVQDDIDFSSFNLYIADFENDSVKISTTTEDWADHITAIYMGSALSDLELRDGFLYSATAAVPEPADFAALFGAIALAVAAYRRR